MTGMASEVEGVAALFERLSQPQEPRRSFLPLTLEHAGVVDALAEAVQADVQGDAQRAERLLHEADVSLLSDYVLRIVGKVDVAVHRQARTPDASTLIVKHQQVGMPSVAGQRQIFERDGWHCRCCGVPVVSPRARASLSKRYVALRWGKRNSERHAGVFALMASLDHALPRSRGGNNDPANLLTVCWPCQFGRMDWTYEEVQMADPRMSAPHPRLAGWKGLTQCL